MNKVTATLRMRDDRHVVRKLWHVGTGLSGLGIYLTLNLAQRDMAIGLLSLALAAFVVEGLRLAIPKVNEVVMIFMGPFMRESERKGLSGFPFYALGAGLSLYLFSEKIAILSILFLMFSDPISSFFGILLGREKIVANKSFQGSLAGFVTCYFLTLIYLDFYQVHHINALGFALFAGLIGALSELLSVFVDDNLTIPVASGFGLTLLNLFIPCF